MARDPARSIRAVAAWPKHRQIALRVGPYACAGCEVRAVNAALKHPDPKWCSPCPCGEGAPDAQGQSTEPNKGDHDAF